MQTTTAPNANTNPKTEGDDLGQVRGTPKRSATIRYDADFDEWIVQFFKDGKHQANADYHTDDEQDALATAKYWIKS